MRKVRKDIFVSFITAKVKKITRLSFLSKILFTSIAFCSFNKSLANLPVPVAPPQSSNIVPPPPLAPTASNQASANSQASDPNNDTSSYKYKIEEEKKDAERVSTFNKLVKKDFHTYVFPKEYYQKGFSDQNSKLPPVIFYSYIAYEAFKTAAEGNLPALRYFLRNYDFALIQDNQGRNILAHTVMAGNMESARVILMKRVVDINTVDIYGKTALHYAVASGDYDMTRLLLTMGASTEVRDKTGLKPIDYLMTPAASPLAADNRVRDLILEYNR